MEPLGVPYQDAHFIAVNKPAGLLVHRSKTDRHETRYALQAVRDQVGRRVYPVHRLDKPTSGVPVFGFTSEAARALTEAFARYDCRPAGQRFCFRRRSVRLVRRSAGSLSDVMVTESAQP